MCTVHGPGAEGDRARADGADVEGLEGEAGTDHVYQGVEPAYLVEVDILGRDAM